MGGGDIHLQGVGHAHGEKSGNIGDGKIWPSHKIVLGHMRFNAVQEDFHHLLTTGHYGRELRQIRAGTRHHPADEHRHVVAYGVQQGHEGI